MARHPFGGGAPDWAVSTADGVPVEAVGGAIVKAYSAFLGGTQYTDLSMDQEGTQIVSQIVASDGTDGLMLGQIPQFYGPDGVWEVWLSANNGPRVRAQALDTADLVQGALDSIADVDATLTQAQADHASIGQANGIATLGADGKLTTAQRPPSATALASLTDVNITSPANGDMLVYDSASSKWKNVSRSTSWTSLTFTGSGMTSVTAQYRKLPATGLVEVFFYGIQTTGASKDQDLFTLPAGFRPGTKLFLCITNNNSSSSQGRIEIDTNGVAHAYWTLSSDGYFASIHEFFVPEN
jgi:hypothetical protein